MTTWTSVASGSVTWTPLHSAGSHVYDDTEIAYDESNQFYDDGNPNLWASVLTGTTTWTSIQS